MIITCNSLTENGCKNDGGHKNRLLAFIK